MLRVDLAFICVPIPHPAATQPAPSQQPGVTQHGDLIQAPCSEGACRSCRAVVQAETTATVSTGFGVAKQAGRTGRSPAAEHISFGMGVIAPQQGAQAGFGKVGREGGIFGWPVGPGSQFIVKPLLPRLRCFYSPCVCSSVERGCFSFCVGTPGVREQSHSVSQKPLMQSHGVSLGQCSATACVAWSSWSFISSY